MYCTKCGSVIDDEAIICPKCGCATKNYSETANQKTDEPDKTSTGLIVASVIIPLIGVILGIVFLCQKKMKAGTTYILVGVIAWVVWSIILAL